MHSQMLANSAARYDCAQPGRRSVDGPTVGAERRPADGVAGASRRRASGRPMSAWAQKMMDDALAHANVSPLAGGLASEKRDSRAVVEVVDSRPAAIGDLVDSRSAAASDSLGSKQVREPEARPPRKVAVASAADKPHATSQLTANPPVADALSRPQATRALAQTPAARNQSAASGKQMPAVDELAKSLVRSEAPLAQPPIVERTTRPTEATTPNRQLANADEPAKNAVAPNAVATTRTMDPNSPDQTINRPKVTFNSHISTRSVESTGGVIDEAAEHNKSPKVRRLSAFLARLSAHSARPFFRIFCVYLIHLYPF